MQVFDELLERFAANRCALREIQNERRRGPEDGIPSICAEQGQQWLAFHIAIPEMEKGPKKSGGAVKGVKIDQMIIGENASLAGSLAQAILFHYCLEVVFLAGVGPVDAGQEGLQLLQHHGAGGMRAAAFEAEPEAEQVSVHSRHSQCQSRLLPAECV